MSDNLNLYLWILIIIGVFTSVFSEHYRSVFADMVTLIATLAFPLFFIILALVFFSGSKVLGISGVKSILLVFFILILIGGVSATLGNDVAKQFSETGNNATNNLFKTDFLKAGLFILLGISFFYFVLIKK